MDYQSTRHRALTAAPSQAVLQGLAPDGGLYALPDWSAIAFDWRQALCPDVLQMAERILSALLPDYTGMAGLVRRAYDGKFETPDLTPLVPVADGYSLELFRGPTSAFKDVALSMLPQLMTAARKPEDDEILILTATSGDTGKAALEGFRDVEGIRILVFYPDEGVSSVQKAQMVTQEGRNVTVCAVKGNFDDAQNGVKAVFTQVRQRGLLKHSGVRLSSANSINIGRLAPQVVYYFKAYRDLWQQGAVELGEKVDFVVPTGNFGDILAGYIAKQLGLPVGTLVCASNANDVLTEFLHTGRYDRRRPFHKTSSPSMDILISSNLERLLFALSGGDDQMVSGLMDQLDRQGFYQVNDAIRRRLTDEFWAGSCNEAQTREMIGRLWNTYHYLADPHTAVAWHVAEGYRRKTRSTRPVVVLSTASAFKFPQAVLEAIGGGADGDEFAMMERLSALTGVPIPKNLASLRQKPVLHHDCIRPEDMLAYVQRKATT